MSWQEEFHKALIDAIVEDGQKIRPDASFYGWADWTTEPRNHVRSVGIDYDASTYDGDAAWSEFQGTFYTGDNTVYGIQAKIVCLDGQVFHWRYRGTLGDMIQSVLAQADA